MEKICNKNLKKVRILIVKIETEVRKILIKLLKLKKFNENISMQNENNWDSVKFIDILTSIENKFKIKISVSDAINFISYKDIIKILKKKLSNK